MHFCFSNGVKHFKGLAPVSFLGTSKLMDRFQLALVIQLQTPYTDRKDHNPK
jgi:hypothetical protein